MSKPNPSPLAKFWTWVCNYFSGQVTDARLPRNLTQSISLEESPMPHLVRVGVGLIVLLMAVFLVWATFTHVDEIAMAQGQVIPSDNVHTIQHLEGGIIKEIMVHDGDLVEKDQALLRLDDTSAAADLGQMTARRDALQLQAGRLRRFTGSAFEEGATLSPDEVAILKSMEEARDSQRQVLRDQIAQKQQQLKGLTSGRIALEKNLSLMREENNIRQDLTRRGYNSRLQSLSTQRELNQLEGQLNEAISQEKQASDAINEAQNRLGSLDADLKQEAMKNLGQTEAELAEVNSNLEKLQHNANRTTITAPVRGIVTGLSVNTVGAVIESGHTLLEIVPVSDKLMIEAMVLPSDIGHVHVGQNVLVNVSAFEFTRYGSASGTLENVSATTFQTPEGHAFYKARIKLNQNWVGLNPGRNLILPGMTVQASIITGEKTVLQYLLKPIQVARETAFREH